MQGTSKLNPFGLRLPGEMRQKLKEIAISNRRSLNSEIVARLEESLRAEEKEKTNV